MIVSATRKEVDRISDMRDAFAHVDAWIFDLDDTLYPRSIGVHRQLKHRVVLFIADHMKIDHAAAEAVHLDYYERFGATLQGLVELHGVVRPYSSATARSSAASPTLVAVPCRLT